MGAASPPRAPSHVAWPVEIPSDELLLANWESLLPYFNTTLLLKYVVVYQQTSNPMVITPMLMLLQVTCFNVTLRCMTNHAFITYFNHYTLWSINESKYWMTCYTGNRCVALVAYAIQSTLLFIAYVVWKWKPIKSSFLNQFLLLLQLNPCKPPFYRYIFSCNMWSNENLKPINIITPFSSTSLPWISKKTTLLRYVTLRCVALRYVMVRRANRISFQCSRAVVLRQLDLKYLKHRLCIQLRFLPRPRSPAILTPFWISQKWLNVPIDKKNKSYTIPYIYYTQETSNSS